MNAWAAEQVLRISLTVPDLDAAVAFYRNALACRLVSRTERHASALADALQLPGTRIAGATLSLGAQSIELLAFDPPGAPYPVDSTSTDLWFQHCAIVVDDMAAAWDHVAAFPIVPISEGGPQTLPANTGGVTAFKFRDPFGHPFELIRFPAGTGDKVWAARGDGALFRGIDHTALSVGDIARSRAFYERQFGMRVTDSSHNAGGAQERLDGLPEDRVDVVALAPRTEPPHVELLGYRTGTRRPIPPATRANDIASTRTVLAVRPAAGTQDADQSGMLLVRDPDGHMVLCSRNKQIVPDLSAL